jgi:cell wall-associated NlpC family hydrolase
MQVEKYIGRPWVATGFNCFELVREVYRNELGVDLPVCGVDGADLLAVGKAFLNSDLKKSFKKIETPVHLCVAAMRAANSKHESHCGVFLKMPDGEKILHNWRGAGVLLEPISRLHWHPLTISGFYQWSI